MNYLPVWIHAVFGLLNTVGNALGKSSAVGIYSSPGHNNIWHNMWTSANEIYLENYPFFLSSHKHKTPADKFKAEADIQSNFSDGWYI